jgi:tetratricopeptide (TPR) repeat protein
MKKRILLIPFMLAAGLTTAPAIADEISFGDYLNAAHQRQQGDWKGAALMSRAASLADPDSSLLSGENIVNTLIAGGYGEARALARQDRHDGPVSPVSYLLLMADAARAGDVNGMRNLLDREFDPAGPLGVFAGSMNLQIRQALKGEFHPATLDADALKQIYTNASDLAASMYNQARKQAQLVIGDDDVKLQKPVYSPLLTPETRRLVTLVSLSLIAAADPDNVPARLELAQIALAGGQPEGEWDRTASMIQPDPQRALDILDELPADTQKQADAAVLRARALHALGQTDNALDWLENVAGMKKQPALHASMGDILALTGDYRRAEAAYTQAIDATATGKIGNLPEIYLRRGQARDNLDNEQGAEEDFRHALAISKNPEQSAAILVSMGCMMTERGWPERAAPLLEQAHEMSGGDRPEYLAALGQAYYALAVSGARSGGKANNLSRAVDLLEQAVEDMPESIEVNADLAGVYEETGRKAEAVWQYRRVIAYATEQGHLTPDQEILVKQAEEALRQPAFIVPGPR